MWATCCRVRKSKGAKWQCEVRSVRVVVVAIDLVVVISLL